MGENKQIDEFDKMFYDYFKNDQEVPQRIHDAIYSAFDRRRQKRKRANILKKVAMIIVTFGVMTTGIVFADDIINFVTSLFTNSTEAIDAAVENGYVQTIDMEYIYDNDIGIKVDNLVIDDTNLDISFVYNYQGIEQIDSLELYEYTIKDENGNIIYEFNENATTKDTYSVITEVIKDNEIIEIDNNIFKESIIYSSENIDTYSTLIIEIKSINLISNNTNNIKNGIWKLKIDLNDIFLSRNNEYYNISDNEYIRDSSITITETSLKIFLDFNMNIDKSYLKETDSIILKDASNREYMYNSLKLEDNENSTVMNLEYDISKYYSDINNLQLIIKIDNSKEIELEFQK